MSATPLQPTLAASAVSVLQGFYANRQPAPAASSAVTGAVTGGSSPGASSQRAGGVPPRGSIVDIVT